MEAKQDRLYDSREGERGAAMVMALLVSFLLLVASAGLLMESSTNTQNVTDATAEQQAYNAAESGIQAAVYVLRDNVTLADADRIDTTKPATDPANRINYLKALNIATSNAGGDSSTTPRLSRWMRYETGFPDRVRLGEAAYTPQNGFAYSLAISDPDHTGALVRYQSTGRFFDNDQAVGGDNMTKTYGSGANKVVLRYYPKGETDLDTTGGAAPAEFGRIGITITGTGAPIVAWNRFEIITRMSHPYEAVRTIRGYIQSNGSSWTTPPKILVDSQTFTLQGSIITLEFNGGTFVNDGATTPPRIGYEAQLTNADAPGSNVIAGSMTSPEPIRLLIQSTGFGPRGATKRLEAIIQKNFFNGLTAPATLTLIGPASTTNPNTTFTFNPGSSNVAVYTGADQASTDIIPPIGTSTGSNLEDVLDSVDGLPPHPFNGDVVGVPSDVTAEMPHWLSTPQRLDAAVKSLQSVAAASGRYFPSGVLPTGTDRFGNHATAQGITFLDGNVEFQGNGGGIMVVTGKLTLKGNFSFRGLIIVTGQGGVDRSGGGNGEIEGNMVIAPYVNSSVLPATEPAGTQFLAPQYDLSGGGNSTISYNSSTLGNGLRAIDNFVLGVAEK
jgi:hypothetical protein